MSLPLFETRATLMVTFGIEAAEARLPGGGWASGRRGQACVDCDTAPPPTKSSYICNKHFVKWKWKGG